MFRSASTRRWSAGSQRPLVATAALAVPLGVSLGVALVVSGCTAEDTAAPAPGAAAHTASAPAPGDASTSAPAPAEADESADDRTSADAAEVDVDASVRPDRLEVPGIGLDEQVVVDLEIQADGRLEDPQEWNDVGWFSQGSGVGEPGPTVIAGHVDSPTGPAVFYEVLDVQPGDEIVVTAADGVAHQYEVSRIDDFPKDDFPTREVFGQQLDDELRLITCTGEFDAQAQRHLDNRVVFAHAVD